ncbi:hypothetical protein P167DRAFT_534299 [Morchella conica CCBAS932]|uniref:Uncharacterized protein n=1 Tax=Morchella conica CCBAS932 TaxID=1392247 RepID=A0A3N4KU69_9PEZI|nr:hypothetical protein P167DRAFT_534299 [Morchella conica CCBAS932]
MVFYSSVARALVVVSAIILSGANCQESIVKPDHISLVTKGEDFSIMWRVIDPPETSHVYITLENPSMDLGSLGIITNAFHVGIDDREEVAGFFLYRYAWFPSDLLQTSDTYQIRVVDGNVTLVSQSFYIGSIADIEKKAPVRKKASGLSTAVIGGVVGGVVGGATVILILIVLVVYIGERGGWIIINKAEPQSVSSRRIEINLGGPKERRYRDNLAELDTETYVKFKELEGSFTYAELPEVWVVEKEATTDLLQGGEAALPLNRKPSARESKL